MPPPFRTAPSAMPPHAVAPRSLLPLPLEASAATGPAGALARSCAASRERDLRVAADDGYVPCDASMLHGLPDVHLARKPLEQWMRPPSEKDKAFDVSGKVTASCRGHNIPLFIFVNDLSIGCHVARLKSRYLFGDTTEYVQAMAEMNVPSCSTWLKCIGPAPRKKNYDNSTQGTDSYDDSNNSRLFVGRLDQSITDDDLLRAFSPFGELVNVKVLASKACGFVTYSNRASAEEAMRMLNGSQLGGNNIRLPWCRCSGNKQYEQDQQNGGQHGRPKSFNPSGFGWSPQDPYAYAQTGHPGYGYYQQQLPTVQLSIKQPNQRTDEVVAEKGCDIVTYTPWPSAEETMRMLNGSQLGGNSLRLSWGCHSANKQDSQKHGWYCFDLSPEVGDSSHKMMNYTSCSTLKIGGPMDGVVASMGMGFLRRGFSGTGGGGNGGGEKEFWHWVEQTYSKPFLEKLDGGLTGMGYDRPTGRMSRIFICALAYSVLCQASKDWYDLYLLLVYGASRHSPDTWDELATAVRPFAQRFLQHMGEECSRDVWGGWEYYERAPSTICWV